MRLGVKVVTDSSCDLPKELAEQWDITVIPCNVHFGDEAYKDGVDLFPDEFYSRLVSSPKLPTTAQPSVNDFLQVYKALSDDGHDVVSVHLSAKFSGTLNSAHQAKALCESARADGAPNRIEIIDSRVASAPLGLLALGAARVAKGSSSCDQVLEEVEGALGPGPLLFPARYAGVPPKGGTNRKGQRFPGIPSEYQAHIDHQGRRGASGGEGPHPRARLTKAGGYRGEPRPRGRDLYRP